MVFLGDYEAGFTEPALGHLECARQENADRLTSERMYWIRAVLKTIYLRYGGEMSEQCLWAETVTRHQMYRLAKEVVSDLKKDELLDVVYFEQHYDIKESAGIWRMSVNFAKNDITQPGNLINSSIEILINMHRYETTPPVKDEKCVSSAKSSIRRSPSKGTKERQRRDLRKAAVMGSNVRTTRARNNFQMPPALASNEL
jgi:hypothetical protein